LKAGIDIGNKVQKTCTRFLSTPRSTTHLTSRRYEKEEGGRSRAAGNIDEPDYLMQWMTMSSRCTKEAAIPAKQVEREESTCASSGMR
jgi:hypothetical protein